jgi:hypothetical protein
MPIGPTLIIDKSTLQSLTIEEAKWLSHHFHPNLIEPLFVEIVGALTATDRRDPVADVAALAKKMLGMGLTTTPNMRHRDLVVGNLLGLEFAMDGRIVFEGVQPIPRQRSRAVLFIPEPPQIEALRRLAEGKFVDREKEGAALLRRFIADVDLRRIREVFETTPAGYKVGDLNEVLAIVDRMLDGRGRYDALRRAIDHLHIPKRYRAKIVRRWKLMGGLPFKDFAPYSYYVLRVETCFDLALGMGLISASDSKNFIDIMYAYYLPFCEVFVSTDKLHRQIIPLFLREDQRFVWGADIKSDASKLRAHYEGLPTEIKNSGTLSYAHLPPKEGDFLVARIFDELRPGWREW